jgi:hypothetical protein
VGNWLGAIIADAGLRAALLGGVCGAVIGSATTLVAQRRYGSSAAERLREEWERARVAADARQALRHLLFEVHRARAANAENSALEIGAHEPPPRRLPAASIADLARNASRACDDESTILAPLMDYLAEAEAVNQMVTVWHSTLTGDSSNVRNIGLRARNKVIEWAPAVATHIDALEAAIAPVTRV